MSAGDTIGIDTGSNMETRKIVKLGTAASDPHDTVAAPPRWSGDHDSRRLDQRASRERIRLRGRRKDRPRLWRHLPLRRKDKEQYEVATVTAVGKPGTQAYLAADAPAGATNIKVTSVADISAGDKIRLDIDSVGHGIETVTVTSVGTQAIQTQRSRPNASAGATNIKVRGVNGFAVGDKITVGTPANKEMVTITAVGACGSGRRRHRLYAGPRQGAIRDERVVVPGTGLDLAAPLKFNHAANMPFSDRGTGISFQPATAFAHSSNEPVQALGTGITLDQPLAHDHEINAAVRDAAVTTAGYQGTRRPTNGLGAPNSPPTLRSSAAPSPSRRAAWCCGTPRAWLSTASTTAASSTHGPRKVIKLPPGSRAERLLRARARRGRGLRAVCFGRRRVTASAGRFPDGADTGSNCTDFLTQATATLPAASAAGATNIKVTSVEGFEAGQTIRIDAGANLETAVIAAVGTPEPPPCAPPPTWARRSSLSPA